MDKNLSNYTRDPIAAVSAHINQSKPLFESNLKAFRKSIPSLLPLVKQPSTKYEVFAHDASDGVQPTNIFTIKTQQCVYGYHGKQSVALQFQSFIENLSEYKLANRHINTEQSSDVCVILGLGAGWHLEHMLTAKKFKYIIVYDTQSDMLNISAQIIDWTHIFQLAEEQQTQIFLQIPNTGQHISADLHELRQQCVVGDVYIYQHFNDKVFCEFMASALYPESVLDDIDDSFYPKYSAGDRNTLQLLTSSNDKFQKNIATFNNEIANIAQTYHQYTPKQWTPCIIDGAFNLIDQSTHVLLFDYLHAKSSELNVQNFMTDPHKDELIINIKSIKHIHYLHHQMNQKIGQLIDGELVEKNILPEVIESFIVYGLEVGFCFEALTAKLTIKNLIICESELDFFYASLYFVDWANILERCKKDDGHIYFNIGDNGQHLIDDFNLQFHKIGQHNLAQTYFYKPYPNVHLDEIFNELRDSLRSALILGENADYSLHCLAHTQEGINRDLPILAVSDSQEHKQTPVFIIGNGPSLDNAISEIRENADNAIIISCGTALSALLNYGIKPDIHAEVEANMASYCWIVRNSSAEQRAGIHFISCNGVHPDTVDLFDKSFLAVKAGESASHYFFKAYPQLQKLHHAYPTVSNFVLSFVLAAGFENVYLHGVDLGFINKENHHSKQSGYYSDGQEITNFVADNADTLKVPGNFLQQVETKFEFKLAVDTMRDLLKAYKGVVVYNTSNGAFIPGTFPLQPDLLMIPNSDKKAVLNTFFDSQFIKPSSLKLNAKIDAPLSASLLKEFVIELPLQHRSMSSFIEDLRAKQVKLVKEHSIALYCLNGTLQGFLARLLKHAYCFDDTQLLGTIIDAWNHFIYELTARIDDPEGLPFDTTCAHPEFVAQKLLKEYYVDSTHQLQIFCCDSPVAEVLEDLISFYQLDHAISVHTNASDVQEKFKTLFVVNSKTREISAELSDTKDNENVVFYYQCHSNSQEGSYQTRIIDPENAAFTHRDTNQLFLKLLTIMAHQSIAEWVMIKSSYSAQLTDIVFPRIPAQQTEYRYDSYWFLLISSKTLSRKQQKLTAGMRLQRVFSKFTHADIRLPNDTKK